MAFLRESLVTSVKTQLTQLAATDVTSPLFQITVEDGVPTFTRRAATPAATTYFVAIYDADGVLQSTAGGGGLVEPDFPSEFTLDDTYRNLSEPFTLKNPDGGPSYLAGVGFIEISGVRDSYTQMVVQPLAPTNAVVANYVAIYSILAFIIIIGGAVLTRALVSITFRSLGQVEATADAIAAGDLSLRMTDVEPRTTEVGRLKAALNAMLSRVDGALAQRDSTVQQMRRFIGDASHELRTPLVTVRGYAELYRMGAIRGDDDIAQSMERIEKEAIRMGLLVEDLLALARLDERRDVVITDVDLRPIARDAALDVRAAAPSRPIAVLDTTVEAPPTAPITRPVLDAETGKRGPDAPARTGALARLRRRPKPTAAASASPVEELTQAPPAGIAPVVRGDENKIRQVVTNLLGNARRFTPETSPIELRLGVDAERDLGWIEIIDHGEGVPDQIKDKIFQRFWRADTSRTRETGGSGLGLSIVASIVEAFHGSVDVRDTPGGGATFRVGFPLSQKRDAAEQLDRDTQPIDPLPETIPPPSRATD
ncbi:HAMP domain-containing sensor histidine kinase [Microbacterium sp. NPDC077184]|uniref:sensor histidine kinase n=1 Tax=Microbacterium sp. NPDC077184 TaxID=3154764 RepID=UPI0034294747